jgi:multicomponent Na+:H+ antiporter subunit D
MIAVPTALLIAAVVVGLLPDAVPSIERMASRFTDHAAYAAWVLHGAKVQWAQLAPSHVQASDIVYGLAATLGAMTFAAVGLFGRRLRESLPSGMTMIPAAALHRLRELHSGHVGDYIAWWTAGASLLGGTCLLALT